MQEEYRLAMRADARITIAKDARASRLQPVASRQDIVDLVTDVMDAAVRALLQELRNGRMSAQGLQQLDLRVGQFDKDDGNAVLRLRKRRRNVCSERIAIERCRPAEIADRDRHVI